MHLQDTGCRLRGGLGPNHFQHCCLRIPNVIIMEGPGFTIGTINTKPTGSDSIDRAMAMFPNRDENDEIE